MPETLELVTYAAQKQMLDLLTKIVDKRIQVMAMTINNTSTEKLSSLTVSFEIIKGISGEEPSEQNDVGLNA